MILSVGKVQVGIPIFYFKAFGIIKTNFEFIRELSQTKHYLTYSALLYIKATHRVWQPMVPIDGLENWKKLDWKKLEQLFDSFVDQLPLEVHHNHNEGGFLSQSFGMVNYDRSGSC